MLLLEDKTSKLIDLLANNICSDTYIDSENAYCELDDLVWDIDRTLDTLKGATKFVVNDEKSPFVVKIPFVGRCEMIWDEEAEEYSEEYEYYEFNYANPDCIWDYCYDEVEKYKIAAAAGFGEFFPFTALAKENKYGIRFYISERVNPRYSFSDASENSKDKAKTLSKDKDNYRFINENFVAKCIDFYGYKRTCDFIEWLKTQPEITEDLHSGNFGVRFNGAPVILDFSGFRD